MGTLWYLVSGANYLFLAVFFAAFLAGAFLAAPFLAGAFLAAFFFAATHPRFRCGHLVPDTQTIFGVCGISWNYELDGFAILARVCPGPKVSRQIELKRRPKPVMTSSKGATCATRS